MAKIKVFLVDDSVIYRQSFIKLVESNPNLELMGTASDPVLADKKFKLSGNPDVLVLDIEMPKMDGITYLRQLMTQNPMRVIIYSAHIETNPKFASEASALGAMRVIQKPTFRDGDDSSKQLIDAIESVARGSFRAGNTIASRQQTATGNTQNSIASFFSRIVAIGSSTGGAAVVEKILTSLPTKIPPIFVVQHMAPDILSSFVNRLKGSLKHNIKIATNGEKVYADTIYFAPGDKHLQIKKISHSEYHVVINDGPKVCHHKPSVDVLFDSFASEVGNKTIAFILTGMGFDGAQGMKHIKEKGGRTFAQNEKTCVVYGMPKEAVALGGVDKEIAPEDVPYYIATS